MRALCPLQHLPPPTPGERGDGSRAREWAKGSRAEAYKEGKSVINVAKDYSLTESSQVFLSSCVSCSMIFMMSSLPFNGAV